MELYEKLKNNMNLDEMAVEEFISAFYVTENTVDLKVYGDLLKDVEVVWACDDMGRDYIMLENGQYYDYEDAVEIIF